MFPFVLLPWFLFRRKANKSYYLKQLTFVLGFSILIFISTDFTNWINYYKYSLSSLPAGSFGMYGNYSLPSFVGNLILAEYDFNPTPRVYQLSMAIGHITGLFLLIIIYYIVLKKMNNSVIEFSILIVAMLICGNRTLSHYFVFLIIPFTMAFALSLHRKTISSFVILFIIFLFLNLFGLHNSQQLLMVFKDTLFTRLYLHYMPLFGLFAFMLFLFLQRSQQLGLTLKRPDSVLTANSKTY